MARVDGKARERAAQALWRARPRVNLVFVAHPIDAESRFGATMLNLIDRGEKVFIVVASDGRLGCTAPVPIPEVIRVRKSEQLEAARLAGVRGVYFLGLPDGELHAFKTRLKERAVYFIRRLKAQAVFTYDPTLFYFPDEAAGGFDRPFGAINHPDHRAVGEAVLEAAYCGSAVRHCFPAHGRRGLAPWAIDDIFLAATAHPNVAVDIAPYAERKRALLRTYRSQGYWQWLEGVVASEKKCRHIPCSPEAYDRGLRRTKPSAPAFMTPLAIPERR